MIVKEYSFTTPGNIPIYKIYSDKNFFLESKGNFYQEAFIKDEDLLDYKETTSAIPAPIANEQFVYQTLIGEYQNITQEQIQKAKEILLKAFKSLPDEEAYRIKFLFNKWSPNEEYNLGDRILYDNELYNVIKNAPVGINPQTDTTYYQKTHRPLDLIEDWDNMHKKIYNTGDRTKIGNYIYESLIDNNIWAPREFPDMWKLVE